MKSNIINNIKRIAYNNVIKDVNDKESLFEYLKRWWCRQYNRPYKDPLLGEYSFEDLVLEYYEILFMEDKEELSKYESELNAESEEEYEDWLKNRMGDDYQTNEEMANKEK